MLYRIAGCNVIWLAQQGENAVQHNGWAIGCFSGGGDYKHRQGNIFPSTQKRTVKRMQRKRTALLLALVMLAELVVPAYGYSEKLAAEIVGDENNTFNWMQRNCQ